MAVFNTRCLSNKGGVVLDGAGEVVVLGVHHLVEDSVEFVSTIVVGELEAVSTRVAIGELIVVKVLVVEWLVNISEIVDEEAESVRSGNVGHAGVETVLNVVVQVRVEVFITEATVSEPLDDVVDGLSEVTGLLFDAPG